MSTHTQPDDGAIAGKENQSHLRGDPMAAELAENSISSSSNEDKPDRQQIENVHENKKPDGRLPALSDAEFRTMNRLATKMEYFVRLSSLALLFLHRRSWYRYFVIAMIEHLVMKLS